MRHTHTAAFTYTHTHSQLKLSMCLFSICVHESTFGVCVCMFTVRNIFKGYACMCVYVCVCVCWGGRTFPKQTERLMGNADVSLIATSFITTGSLCRRCTTHINTSYTLHAQMRLCFSYLRVPYLHLSGVVFYVLMYLRIYVRGISTKNHLNIFL